MWKVAICFGLLLINKSSAIEESTDNKPIKENNASMSISSSSAFPSTELSLTVSSTSPSSNTEQTVETTSPQSLQYETTTRRRQITFDQRQEGQYNIRADLENFMIVVIPPNPIAGVNLLDILTRSSVKRSNTIKKATKKHQILPKFNRPLVKVDNPNSYGFLSRMHQQSVVPIGGHQNKFSEFIEGRTPYKVDISSSADHDISRVQSEPQVDVLPPTYPLHLHLMKPYHLDAEPTIIQSPSIYHQPTQGKYFEYVNDYGASRRIAKSIKDRPLERKDLITNTVTVNNGEGGQHSNQKKNLNDEVENSDFEPDYSNNSPYSVFDSQDENGFDEYKTRIFNIDDIMENDELKLIGATEQCGPDGRRDSYGKCHYFPELTL